MKNRILSLLLALCMALALLPTPAAAAPILIAPNPNSASAWLIPKIREAPDFPDVADTWCESYVDVVYQTGLMTGKTDTKFDAVSPLTNAQITVITARLDHLLRGGDGVLSPVAADQPWYQSAVDHLRQHSKNEDLTYLLDRLEQDETRPNDPCLRGTFVQMLSAVLTRSMLIPVNEVTVLPDVTGSSVETYLPFYQAGILTGRDTYGTFGEFDPLTRGAAAAMLSRIAVPSLRLTFKPKPFDLCRDVLGVEPDTVLLTIEGTPVPAELFAEQLCTSLHQWEGYGKGALEDAVKFWCHYQGAFRILAAEMGISLSEAEQEEIRQESLRENGNLGLPAAYWQFRKEGSHLNAAMRSHYIDWDFEQGYNGKVGESYYHRDLEACAETMIQNTVPTEALTSMDLSAVYSRLKNSPFIGWRF